MKNWGGTIKKGGCDICGEQGECYKRLGRGNWQQVFICRKCAKKGKGRQL